MHTAIGYYSKKLGFESLFLAIFLTAFVSGYAQNHGTGLVFDDDAYEQEPRNVELLTRDYESLPPKVSMRAYCPTPGDQGQYGTCTAWATAWGGRTILHALGKGQTDKAKNTKEAYSPGFVYQLIRTERYDNCEKGTNIERALEIIKTRGVPLFTDFSYKCPPEITSTLYEQAVGHRIKGYSRLFDILDREKFKIQATKKALSEYHPVAIGMACPPSFQTSRACWIPSESPGWNYGGHAMCVIGYDDSKYGGAFEVLNSWGSNWADGGYVWIRYDDFANFVRYGFEMRGEEAIKPVSQTEGKGSLYLQLASGERVQWKTIGNEVNSFNTTQGYISGTRYRLYFQNSQPGYVYILGSDMTGAVSVLFPPDEKTSAYISYKNVSFALPDQNWYIQMDNTVGRDFLCLLYSRKAIDIESIKQQAEKKSGPLYNRILSALGNPASKQTAKANGGLISFGSPSATGEILTVFMEMQHF